MLKFSTKSLFKLNYNHFRNIKGISSIPLKDPTVKSDIKDVAKKLRKPRYDSHQKPVKASKSKECSVLFSEKLNLKYTKFQLHDPYLSNLMLLAKSRKQRSEKHQIFCEGIRLIKDAIDADFKLNYLLCNNIDNLDPLIDCLRDTEAEIIKVPMHDLKNWTCLTTCPGVIGIFEKREVKKPKNCLPVTIICDNIREPNNLGSIVRVAAALPCSNVITMKGCADVWDAKCLRGGSGGHFNIPIVGSISWIELTEKVHSMPHRVILADNNVDKYESKKIIEYSSLSILPATEPIFVVIGGETHGISEEAIAFAKRTSWSCLHIPLAGHTNSLNTTAALGIILFEIRKKIQISSY